MSTQIDSTPPFLSFSFKRVITWLFSLLLITFCFAILGLYLFFDPNYFKKDLAALIARKTGIPLELQGNIQLKVYPWLGLKANDVILAQPHGFKKGVFIHIQELGFKMPFKDLLTHQLNVQSLNFKDIQLNLIKNSQGVSNWDLLKEGLKKGPEFAKAQETIQHQQHPLKFSLNDFHIDNLNVNFNNEQTQESYLIQKININGRSPDKGVYPIDGTFNLSWLKQNVLQGSSESKFNGNVILEPKLLAQLKTHNEIELPKLFKNDKLKASLNVNLTPTTLTLNNIELDSKVLNAKANASIPLDSLSPIKMNATISEINVDSLPIAQTTQTASQHNEVKKKVSKSLSLEKEQPIQGELQIKNLIVKGLNLHNVKAKILINQKAILVPSFHASLYQGNLSGSLKQALIPNGIVSVQGKVAHIEMQELLNALQHPQHLKGKVDLDFNLTYQKSSGLNGQTKFDFKEGGAWEGVDIFYHLNQVKSFLKKETNRIPDTKHTPFQIMRGTLLFKNNVMSNYDLFARSQAFSALGRGDINLNNHQINYKVQAWREYKKGLPLAIKLSGTLKELKVRPDIDLYVKSIASSQIEKQIDKQIDKQLDKHLGKYLNKLAPVSSKEDEDNKSSSGHLKENVKEEVGKHLKKIFKL